MEQLGVPFVALRPGAFLDQVTRFGGDPFRKGRLTWMGSPRIPLTFVLTSDLAGYLAEAVDLPDLEGRRIDIGWDRPVGMQDVADIAGRLTGKTLSVRTVPAGILRAAGTVLAPVSPMAKDLSAMIEWFQTGRYVADTTLQRQFFGEPPTAELAIRRFVTGLGQPLKG